MRYDNFSQSDQKGVAAMHETLAQDQLFVTVDALILTVREGHLCALLSRRTRPPFEGRWALPGRLVALNETAEATVEALLSEMLPEGQAFCEQLYTFTDLNRDPRGRVISIAYLAAIPEARLPARSDALPRFRIRLEGDELTLTPPEGPALTGSDLAFDHGGILTAGIRRLRGKIDYTDIAFRFLNDPEAFSLSELQAIFEAVLDRPIDASNFRRTIRTRYEDTNRVRPLEDARRKGRGRPAALYRFAEAPTGASPEKR